MRMSNQAMRLFHLIADGKLETVVRYMGPLEADYNDPDMFSGLSVCEAVSYIKETAENNGIFTIKCLRNGKPMLFIDLMVEDSTIGVKVVFAATKDISCLFW